MKIDSLVNEHYGRSGLMERIEAGITASGAALDRLSVDDLAPVDEFHTRGRAATAEIAAIANLVSSDLVLDVGCGLGGTARHLADRYGCKVKGVDLTDEYISIGQKLTELVGLSDRVELRSGNALELPFDDNTFDVVWTQHVQMNIQDKTRFYREISRVLKPGGRFLFHDIFRASDEPLKYPVPWAESEAISFLATAAEARGIMEQEGLKPSQWIEKNEESKAFFKSVIEKVAANGPPPIGIHLLMGANALEKIKNYLSNLTSGRTCVCLGLANKRI